MTTDSGSPRRPPTHLHLSRLPDVLSLRISPRRFDPPRRETRNGVDLQVTEALQFEVEVSGPFPSRALWPVLWVGAEALTAGEVDGHVYRFFAFEPDKLVPDAPIELGWSSPGEARKATRYRFTRPGPARR